MIIDYDDDKENMPNESDYEDLPSMYKDEDDDVDEDDEDDEDDDSIFTSKQRLYFSAPSKIRKPRRAFSEVTVTLSGKRNVVRNA